MDIFRISFYEQFQCLAGDCPEVCCNGFSIPVEEKTYQKLIAQGGFAGLKARLCIRGKEDDRLLNSARRKCPYLQRDALCALQINGGDRLQPHACKIFPRRRQNFGCLAEETLDLSCPEAARLFLKAGFPFARTHVKGEVPYGRSGNNEDEVFLKGIMLSREGLLRCLGTAADCSNSEQGLTHKDIDRLFACVWSVAEEIQEKCTRGETDILTRIDELIAEAPEETGKRKLFPLEISLMNEWMNGDIYNDDLRYRIPLLFELCKLYFKRFDKLNETSGQIRLEELYRSYFKQFEKELMLYIKYAAYYLCRFYSDTYEDYSFVKRIRDMVMHANLLLLLNALYADEYGKIPDHIEARLIASYEKRAFHSYGLRMSMYKRWGMFEETESLDKLF